MKKRITVKTNLFDKLKTIYALIISILLTLISLPKPTCHLNLYQRTNQLLMKYMATWSSYKSLRFLFNLINPIQRLVNPVDIVTTPYGDWIGNRHGNGYVLVYFHGGGYAIGNSTQNLTSCKDWLKSEKVDCVFSVDYPLAPESVYPEQIEFAKEAVSWLCGQGVPMERMVLMGDSAGGHAVITTLMSLVNDTDDSIKVGDRLPSKSKKLTHLVKNRTTTPSRKSTENLRSNSKPLGLPKGVVLISPWVDPTASKLETQNFYHDEDYLTPETLIGFRDVAFPNPSTWKNDNVNLFLIRDETIFKIFSKVPVMIAFGGIEILSNQIIRFGNNINRVLGERESPVRVEFDVDPDMPHVYQAFGSMHFGKNATLGNARIVDWIEKL